MGKGSSRLVLGATSVVSLLAIFLLYDAYFTSDISPFDSWKHHLSNWNGSLGRRKVDKGVEVVEPLEFMLRRLVRGEDRVQLETTGFSCHTDRHSEVCVTNKPVMLDNNALTAYIQSSQVQVKHMVQPYARKEDERAMKQVTPVQILTRNASSPVFCHFNHDVPVGCLLLWWLIQAIYFMSLMRSSSPYSSHATTLDHTYNLSSLILSLAKDGSVHCFPGAVVGLKYHDNLALYPTEIPGGYSMFDFKHFLRKSYNLKIKNVSDIIKPKLILISRPKTRTFMNEEEMVDMMEELGFQVVVATPNRMSNLDKFAEELNSCSVMVGAHGAGLTNAVFLPAGAVMVQVVPLGLDWASTNYFGGPASEMGVALCGGYDAARATYVDGQNMKINLVKFREILLKAMTFLGH
uniref:Glycosyltransferase 61 catalytic domain-containing protein n=1 Tax=Fagus sylvatica TaxID=28930 RepID=A0A2N9IG88_FAGSY